MWGSISQAAKIHKVTTRTIRRWIQADLLLSDRSKGLLVVWLEEEIQTKTSVRHDRPQKQHGMTLFRLYEGLALLRARCEGPLNMSEWLARSAPDVFQPPQLKQWEFLFRHFDRCYRRIDKILEDFRLDPVSLLETYRTLVILKTHWQESGIRVVSDQLGEERELEAETLQILDDLVTHARTLLLASQHTASSEHGDPLFFANLFPNSLGTNPESLHQHQPVEKKEPLVLVGQRDSLSMKRPRNSKKST